MGGMEIELILGTKSVKKKPCKLADKYKEIVQKEN